MRRTCAGFAICAGLILFASAACWDAGWRHYYRGGGAAAHAPVITAELEQAAKYFAWAGRINPLSAKAHNYQGKSLNYLGRYEEALGRFNATLRFHPRNLTARYGRAYAYMKLSRYPEAASELRRAFAIESDLDSKVRFSGDFAHLRDEPFMAEFRSRMHVQP